MTLQVFWTRRALENVQAIEQFLLQKFTLEEVGQFLGMLKRFEERVVEFPYAYRASSQHKETRRAVLHHRLSVSYEVTQDAVVILSVFDTRMDAPIL